MPGIRRTRAASDEDVVVTRSRHAQRGITVFRAFRDPVTSEVLRDDTDVSARLFTWTEVAAQEGQAFADRVRRLNYKLLGATNAEADAAIAADDGVSP